MNLGYIVLRFQDRNARLLRLVDNAVLEWTSNRARAKAVIGQVIVKLLDEWSCRCRQMILVSAAGSVSRSGRAVPRSPFVSHAGSAIVYLRRPRAPGRAPRSANWEPKWHIPNEAISAASRLALSNLAEVTNGLGASQFAEHLRITRNLIAHNLPNTWQQFKAIALPHGVPGNIEPEEFVITRTPSGPRFIEAWVDDLENAFAAAAI